MHTAYCKCCNSTSLSFTGVTAGLTNSHNNKNALIANKVYKSKANSITKEVSSQLDSSVSMMCIKFSATPAQLLASYHLQQRNSSCMAQGKPTRAEHHKKLQPFKQRLKSSA